MAEKKWSDYWKEYKSSKGKKTYTSEKKAISIDRKPHATERPKPIIKVGKPKVKRPSKSRINLPSKNRQVSFLILLFVAIAALSFLQFRSGQEIKTLQVNVTNLTDALDSCAASNIELSKNFGLCTSNLEDCQGDLSSKSTLLSECNSDRDSFSKNLESCRATNNRIKDDIQDLQLEYDSIQEYYDECRNDRDEAEDNYNDLLTNLRGYAGKGKCCGTSNNVSYSIENNEVVCYGNDDGDYSLSC
jgi:hypothetical protein